MTANVFQCRSYKADFGNLNSTLSEFSISIAQLHDLRPPMAACIDEPYISIRVHTCVNTMVCM